MLEICRECGRPFVKRLLQERLCSDACRDAAGKRQRREHRRRKALLEKRQARLKA